MCQSDPLCIVCQHFSPKPIGSDFLSDGADFQVDRGKKAATRLCHLPAMQYDQRLSRPVSNVLQKGV